MCCWYKLIVFIACSDVIFVALKRKAPGPASTVLARREFAAADVGEVRARGRVADPCTHTGACRCLYVLGHLSFAVAAWLSAFNEEHVTTVLRRTFNVRTVSDLKNLTEDNWKVCEKLLPCMSHCFYSYVMSRRQEFQTLVLGRRF
jgi:hypothetical protein